MKGDRGGRQRSVPHLRQVPRRPDYTEPFSFSARACGSTTPWELASRGIDVELRTLQRAVVPLRQEERAEALATVRFETSPGQQMQIDFGEKIVRIAGQAVTVYLMTAVLGYSRRKRPGFPGGCVRRPARMETPAPWLGRLVLPYFGRRRSARRWSRRWAFCRDSSRRWLSTCSGCA
jgi:transposase